VPVVGHQTIVLLPGPASRALALPCDDHHPNISAALILVYSAHRRDSWLQRSDGNYSIHLPQKCVIPLSVDHEHVHLGIFPSFELHDAIPREQLVYQRDSCEVWIETLLPLRMCLLGPSYQSCGQKSLPLSDGVTAFVQNQRMNIPVPSLPSHLEAVQRGARSSME
jgi:hypothetical protein